MLSSAFAQSANAPDTGSKAAKPADAPALISPFVSTTTPAETAMKTNSSANAVPNQVPVTGTRPAGDKSASTKPVNPLTGSTLAFERKLQEARELDVDLLIAQKKKAIADLNRGSSTTPQVSGNVSPSRAATSLRPSVQRGVATNQKRSGGDVQTTPIASLLPASGPAVDSLRRPAPPKLRAVTRSSNGRAAVIELSSGETLSIGANSTAAGITVSDVGDSFAIINGVRQAVLSSATIVGVAPRSVTAAVVATPAMGSSSTPTSPVGAVSQPIPFQPSVGAPLPASVR